MPQKANRNVKFFPADPDKGQRHHIRERHHVLPREGPDQRGGECGRLQRVSKTSRGHNTQECSRHQEPGGYSS